MWRLKNLPIVETSDSPVIWTIQAMVRVINLHWRHRPYPCTVPLDHVDHFVGNSSAVPWTEFGSLAMTAPCKMKRARARIHMAVASVHPTELEHASAKAGDVSSGSRLGG
jgi:hypothetical protein